MRPAADRSARFIQLHVGDSAAERDAAAAGLMASPATISPKHFYDGLGSRLFEAITELPEYYATRTEAAIFETHGPAIAEAIGSGATLVDLGAGNCEKALRLFPLLEPRRYVAVDISAEFLRHALQRVAHEHPAVDVVGIGLDLTEPLALPEGLAGERPVFFYPGSSIGNFTPDAAVELLRGVRKQASGGGLLVGVDLVKPAALLNAAYDDALGVTAAFNLNALRNLNRLLASDFDPADWRHVAFFDAAASRVEMHLEARRELTVRCPGIARRFAAGERIHTENSCKYTPESFAALLGRAGFGKPRQWTDAQGWFGVFWAPAD
ncbi:L-histidine N(alpha)-methyltransferase [Piscinibacter koreensis]|uniref:L-histidine N(Alpha)-methyltransferase n=1 Tax=Piscinibacter koreensis TaxID=2742824 RepID=A0A7Y6NR85_9BURK|nr:L-histidine N(alpha)-methyltransferase [Schlegelella koreensis]NUZ07844.1 L-histidine N(alpha)-methyltransferase [Schlegelella koreensis]